MANTGTPDPKSQLARMGGKINTQGLMKNSSQTSSTKIQKFNPDSFSQLINDDLDVLLKQVEKTVGQSPKPKLKPYDLPARDTYGDFKSRMLQSESSGNYTAQIQLDDGRFMTGGFQFSDARLKDYTKATGEAIDRKSFKNNADLQNKVMDWHLNSIDKTIAEMGVLEQGYDRDGLRAVAHLGGIAGMKKFVKTKGKYNPADKFGTTLQSYYNKFSKPKQKTGLGAKTS